MREKEERHKQEMKEKDRQYQEMKDIYTQEHKKEMREKEERHKQEMKEKETKIARLELQLRHKGKISMCCIKKFHTPVTQN